MRMRDVMTRNVISIGADQSILKAARLMLQNEWKKVLSILKFASFFRGECAGNLWDGIRNWYQGTRRA